jgi:hypothetical protein
MLSTTLEVKQLNRERIRRQVQEHETCTKSEVSHWTSLSVSTCNMILNEMVDDGEVLCVAQEEPSVGRPASRFRYNPDHMHVLVMYVSSGSGGNTIGFAVANAMGEILWRGERHPRDITYQGIEDLVAEQLSTDDLIRSMAFGFPGVSHDGVIERCDIDTLVGVDVEGLVEKRFGLTPELRNDMDFIANGVYHSISHNGGNLATIFFPEDAYVGCGLVLDGKVLRGHSKFAGELAYVAEGFGISRRVQREAMGERQAFRELAARMVLVVCGTVDPEVVMLMGNQIGDDDLEAIRSYCAPIISTQHIPRLVADNNVAEYYLSGLIRVVLDLSQFPLLT